MSSTYRIQTSANPDALPTSNDVGLWQDAPGKSGGRKHRGRAIAIAEYLLGAHETVRAVRVVDEITGRWVYAANAPEKPTKAST
jgi:hypothetical protein